MADALSALARQKKRKAIYDAAIDVTRGGLLGLTTDNVGYLPDAVAGALRPFGYNVPPENVVGGSQWLANRLTQPTGSKAETVGRVLGGMVAPGTDDLMRLAGLLPKKAPMLNELTTYHGSPHRINNVDEANPLGKFDLSKVGTGEGAQAYGHGVYLAENPGVAKSYQTKLSGGIEGLLVDAQTARTSLMDRVEKASRKMAPGDPNAGGLPIAAAHVDRLLQDAAQDIYLKKQSSKWVGMLPNAFRELKKFGVKTDDLFTENKGHFYTVDLPDEHIAKMLDWDAPLSEQPESVRKALQLATKVKSRYPAAADGKLGGAWEIVGDNGVKVTMTPEGKGFRMYAEHPVFGVLDRFAVNHTQAKDVARKWLTGESKTGEQLMSGVYGFGKGPEASQKLLSLGIPGIKYFDGGSRAAGNGTRNFVIFDPDIAKILKRE